MFQHAIKDHFLELGFIAQEEHPATRTDICLTSPPLEIAVECKHVEEGVTPAHVQTFDERLKLWQEMERPCLGVMVATRFQEETKKLCCEKNILCLTQQQIEDALARRRHARLSTEILPVSHKVANLLKALRGLLDSWIPHLFGDPVDAHSLFFNNLLSQGYVTMERKLRGTTLILNYPERGREFFEKCRLLFGLVQEMETQYVSETQIARSIADALAWPGEGYQVYDKIILLGLGVLEQRRDGLCRSAFAEDLLQATCTSQDSLEIHVSEDCKSSWQIGKV